MKILHISDTHGKHHQLKDLPEADVIVHTGDITEEGTEEEVKDFIEWFCSLPYKHKIFIAGNHDDCLYGANIDDRYGVGVITSRIGVQREATAVGDDTNILELFMKENERQHIDCVLVDECQFLKKHHVQELVEIVDSCNTPVICYGLKNDFRNELFEGSYYMLVYADKIEEIKTICWCGRKATMVARVVDGKIVKSGDQIVVGGNDLYVSLCRKHYNDGRLGPSK